MLKKRVVFLLAAALLAVFAFRLASLARLQSDTYDELKCLRAGEHISRDLDWSVEASIFHPPLSYYLHGFPLQNKAFNGDKEKLTAARSIMLIFPVLLGLYIFLYARKKFGEAAGVFALFLYSFCPNVIAQSSLIQPDMLVTTFIFIGFYLYARSLDDVKNTGKKLAAGLALGLALLSKYTGVFLLPITALLGLLYVYQKRLSFSKFIKQYVYVALVGLLILNAGYLFRGSFTPLRSYSFESGFFSRMAALPVVSRLPVPAPAPFVYGFDSQKNITEGGHPSFLAGERSITGRKDYFVIAYLIKTPIPFLVLLLASFFVGFRKKTDLLIPVACLTLPFIFFTNSTPGLRYLLPAYPFLFIYVSNLAVPLKNKLRLPAIVTLLLLSVWYIGESIFIHPHYIAYFNEFIGGPRNGYKYLADSNIDWGQDWYLVEKYRKENPDAKLNPEDPAEGRILINVNTLQDVFRIEEKHRWLKEFAPSGTIGYSWNIYDLSRGDYEEILKRKPDDAYVNYMYGFVTGDRTFLEKAAKIDPGLDAARLKLSLISMEEGNYGRAVSELEELLKANPSNSTALYYLSWIYDRQGNTALARKYDKRSTVAKTLNSYTVFVSTDADGYGKTLSKDPKNAKAWNNLGFLYWAGGDLDGALAAFGKARELNPRQVDYLGNLAVVYRDKGMQKEYEAARLEYRRIFGLIPTSRVMRLMYGNEMMTFGDTLVIPFPEGFEK